MRTVYERADVVQMIAEIFRELGYEGASLSRITERTGLGKGSLYHFFPGGKEEMASAILASVAAWFENFVYEPLRHDDSEQAIAAMWKSVDDYFCSGKRICLVGAFALDDTRDRFASAIRSYFTQWIDALRDALVRSGRDRDCAMLDAEEAVLGIQGALVLARALNDKSVFSRALDRLAYRLANATPNGLTR
ncbi:TetR/AcrR family transcriptional regulator [Acidocella sp.]|uniref:TetR/AcrR family transcriptional regulator n=1 Tax=Acidocella sp. TaxID=50710 RepID=UPI00261C6B80|nr:TetR/AcrR family transcriptional regulator [Acidocella sp.]